MIPSPDRTSSQNIPRASGRAWRMEVHDRLGSTSDTCKARLDAGQGKTGLPSLP
ncbi:hypothetical protein RAA17_19465 [Komagataeibacter rhaeticus]|nr:hypothetical protein [Komagataeibacter rhaeticus]